MFMVLASSLALHSATYCSTVTLFCRQMSSCSLLQVTLCFVNMQSTPALTTAALELLAHFPSDKCKVPVERTYKLRSPRGGRSLRSPERNSTRGSDRSASLDLSNSRLQCAKMLAHASCWLQTVTHTLHAGASPPQPNTSVCLRTMWCYFVHKICKAVCCLSVSLWGVVTVLSVAFEVDN